MTMSTQQLWEVLTFKAVQQVTIMAPFTNLNGSIICKHKVSIDHSYQGYKAQQSVLYLNAVSIWHFIISYYFESLDRKRSHGFMWNLTAGRCLAAPWSHPSAAGAERWDRGDGEESGNWPVLTETTLTGARKSHSAQAVWSETTFSQRTRETPLRIAAERKCNNLNVKLGCLCIFDTWGDASHLHLMRQVSEEHDCLVFPFSSSSQEKKKGAFNRLLNRTQKCCGCAITPHLTFAAAAGNGNRWTRGECCQPYGGNLHRIVYLYICTFVRESKPKVVIQFERF